MTTTAEAPVARSRGWRESPWTGFLLRRTGSFVFALWFVLTAVFFLTRAIGGDSVRAAAGLTVTPEYVAARRAALGLDDPILTQYWHFLVRIVHFDFGESTVSGQPVLASILDRVPYTFQLGLYAFALAAIVSVPLGMWVATRTQSGRNRALDTGFNSVTGFFASVPDYLLAVGLVLVFSVGLGVFPAAGGAGPSAFVLPVLTVAFGPIAVISRLVRVETSRVLQEDYIRTARSNHLRPATVLFRHVLPNVLTATLTYAGMLLAALLGGTVITENVFAWPGIGSLLVKSLRLYDYPTVEGAVVITAATVLMINLLVDLLLAAVDPKSLIVRS
ncbi:peptide/nickel transport system permease protein [Kibdelosporangium banguiense]|uniref:Peptide/nickel transport system permease protein n=1 Tax=Kibdelosporangium banguiense TaxID=1365924 RepID=A0ABS4TXV6_9PSEU|nr:ABC transporter permease [Kibdelosporangium banguiense]MBP2329237.1 peptide/nickel transport system permease protein [Kibdelosporangium banguiense]